MTFLTDLHLLGLSLEEPKLERQQQCLWLSLEVPGPGPSVVSVTVNLGLSLPETWYHLLALHGGYEQSVRHMLSSVGSWFGVRL